MWPQFGAIPSHLSTDTPNYQAYDPADQRMRHRSIWRHSRRDIAAQNGVHGSIDGSDQEQLVRHPLSKRRKHTQRMKHGIGTDRKNNNCDESRHHCPNTSSQSPPGRNGTWRLVV